MTAVIDIATPRLDDTGRTSSVRLGHGFIWNHWYVAGVSADLKSGQSLSRRMLGRPVLVGRNSNGSVYALSDRCPHRAVPLSSGRTEPHHDGDVIECPYHGWRFRSDGRCIAVPAETDPEFKAEAIRVPAYPTVETQGLIWIWMDLENVDGPPGAPPPLIPTPRGHEPLVVATVDYPVHVDHAILGLVDPAHGPYVHRQWWWRKRTRAREKVKAFAPSRQGFTMIGHSPSESGRLYWLFGSAPWTEIVFQLPGIRWEHVRLGKRMIVALSAMTPIDDQTTRMTQIIWTDQPILRALAPLVALATRQFLREDETVITAQSRGLADNPPFLWVGDADQQARWYVQLKRAWGRCGHNGSRFENPVRGKTLRWRS